MVSLKYIVFAILAVDVFTAVRCSELEEFVRLKMTNYSTWLKTNGFDPSGVQTGPDRFSVQDANINMEWELRNHYVEGHSYEIDVTRVLPNLELNYFAVEWFSRGNVTFQGKYTAKGTVGWSELPISGEGQWSMTVPFVEQYFNFIHYSVSPSGNLAFDRAYMGNIYFQYNKDYIHCENLFDSEAGKRYEDIIKFAMRKSFSDYLLTHPQYPLKAAYVQFWKEVLPLTTLEDISG